MMWRQHVFCRQKLCVNVPTLRESTTHGISQERVTGAAAGWLTSSCQAGEGEQREREKDGREERGNSCELRRGRRERRGWDEGGGRRCRSLDSKRLGPRARIDAR